MRVALILLAVLAATPVWAEVTAASPVGFTVRESFQTAAPPQKVWALLVIPARWWDSEHTWSGSAANLTLDARAGGCWCETLGKDGSVQHMTVDFVDPGKTLRMRGAIGPLGSLAVTGVMGIAIEAQGGGSSVTLSYQVSGFVPVDLQGVAPDVDTVLAAQMTRLKAAIEAP
jgi:uncharacterized protein YndB with AHSA1/START domain